MKTVSVSEHYDLLIKNNNDPILDSDELKAYMNEWDGETFIQTLCLNNTKSVLEIGCGTGRILQKILNRYKTYAGVDLSPLTVKRAKEYFPQKNVRFICDDFLQHPFCARYDVIFSTLTFMHVKEKENALAKIYSLLNKNGLFALSIDKNQETFIDTGYSRIEIYPDNPTHISNLLSKIGFQEINIQEIKLAYIISATKRS